MQPTWPGMSGPAGRSRARPRRGWRRGALAAVEPAAVDEQRLVAVVQRGPLDRLLREVELGNAMGDPVEELEAVLVAFIHRRHRGVDSGGGIGGDGLGSRTTAGSRRTAPGEPGAVSRWTGTEESVWSRRRARARPGLPLPRTVLPPIRSTCPALRQQDGGSVDSGKALRSCSLSRPRACSHHRGGGQPRLFRDCAGRRCRSLVDGASSEGW